MKEKRKPINPFHVLRFACLLGVIPLWVFIFLAWPQHGAYTFVLLVVCIMACLIWSAVRELGREFFSFLWTVTDPDWSD